MGVTTISARRITRRAGTGLVACFLSCLSPSCGPREQKQDWIERPPNVLLITIDTLRADHLGTYGYGRNTSPRIDEFARQSQVFENAQASSSWTLPGLATLMTGEHSSTHGCWTFASSLGPSFETLPERLLARGYDTASFTTNIFTVQGYGLQQGIVLPDDEHLRSSDARLGDVVSSPRITDGAIEFLETKGKARQAADDPWPWMLWLHYFDPHDTYLAHPGISEEFQTPDADAMQVKRDLYDGEIRYTDDHIGRVLDALQQSGQAEETIVVLTSDHGEEFGDHGKTHHGHTLHGELTNVPLIVRAPGFNPARISAIAQGVDLYPTLLQLTGCQIPGELPGRNLVPLFGTSKEHQEMRADSARQSAVQEVRLLPHASFDALRTQQWTLIRALNETAAIQLFDRSLDPLERNNCADSHPEVVRQLTQLLDNQLLVARDRAVRFGTAGMQDLSAEQLDTLRALGYVDRD